MGPLPTPGFFPFSLPEPADFPTAVSYWAPRSLSCSPCPCSCPTSPAWVMGPAIQMKEHRLQKLGELTSLTQQACPGEPSADLESHREICSPAAKVLEARNS